jgi:hypothetical protein
VGEKQNANQRQNLRCASGRRERREGSKKLGRFSNIPAVSQSPRLTVSPRYNTLALKTELVSRSNRKKGCEENQNRTKKGVQELSARR